MQLPEIQDKFKNYLLQPAILEDGVSNDFRSLFDEKSIPAKNRLEVYRNNVMGGLTKALSGNFPLLEKLVGKEFLTKLCMEYIQERPPSSAYLNDYGQSFDQFLYDHPCHNDYPYLSEIAYFEWATTRAEHARDAITLQADELAIIQEEHLSDTKLRLHPSVHLMEFSYPVLAIQNFCENPNQVPPDIMQRTKSHVMICRPKLEICIIQLPICAYHFLKKVQESALLGEALASTLKDHPDFNFAEFLKIHLGLGTFSSLKNHLD